MVQFTTGAGGFLRNLVASSAGFSASVADAPPPTPPGARVAYGLLGKLPLPPLPAGGEAPPSPLARAEGALSAVYERARKRLPADSEWAERLPPARPLLREERAVCAVSCLLFVSALAQAIFGIVLPYFWTFVIGLGHAAAGVALLREVWLRRVDYLKYGLYQPLPVIVAVYINYVTLAEALDKDSYQLATEDDLEQSVESNIYDRVTAELVLGLDCGTVLLSLVVAHVCLDLNRAYEGIEPSDQPWILQFCYLLSAARDRRHRERRMRYPGAYAPALGGVAFEADTPHVFARSLSTVDASRERRMLFGSPVVSPPPQQQQPAAAPSARLARLPRPEGPMRDRRSSREAYPQLPVPGGARRSSRYESRDFSPELAAYDTARRAAAAATAAAAAAGAPDGAVATSPPPQPQRLPPPGIGPTLAGLLGGGAKPRQSQAELV